MEYKICKRCGKELPMNEEYFAREKRNKSGLTGNCKMCISEQKKDNYGKNRAEILAKQKDYAEKNKEQIKKYKKQYRENNREKICLTDRIYRKNNKEKCKIISANWYQKNKEHVLEKARMYKEKHKAYYSNYLKIYSRENKQKFTMYNQRRKSNKRKLDHTLNATQWEEIKKCFDNKCAYCGKELPLQQEHFIALSKDGEYTKNNIIPSCKSCNSSKGDKDFFEWYPKYRYYSKKRESKILNHLGYKDDKQQLKLF